MKIKNTQSKPIRVDILISESLKISRRHSKRVCDFNKLSHGKMIFEGEEIEIEIPVTEELKPETIEIFKEEKDFLVFNKLLPAHMEHIDGKVNASIENLIKEKYSKDFQPCQRLDFETLGLFLVAKNQNTFDRFREMFKSHQITKYYEALVIHDFESKVPMTIESTIKYVSHQPLKMITDRGGEDFNVEIIKKDKNKLFLKTNFGFPHIIRASLEGIGYPLLGDRVYGGGNSQTFSLLAYGIESIEKDLSYFLTKSE